MKNGQDLLNEFDPRSIQSPVSPYMSSENLSTAEQRKAEQRVPPFREITLALFKRQLANLAVAKTMLESLPASQLDLVTWREPLDEGGVLWSMLDRFGALVAHADRISEPEHSTTHGFRSWCAGHPDFVDQGVHASEWSGEPILLADEHASVEEFLFGDSEMFFAQCGPDELSAHQALLNRIDIQTRYLTKELTSVQASSGLTADMLREAAAWLSPDHTDHRLEFMCHALSVSVEGAETAAMLAFIDLLDAHDVSYQGCLMHRGRGHYEDLAGNLLPATQVQNHRFDFLNLLACEIESP